MTRSTALLAGLTLALVACSSPDPERGRGPIGKADHVAGSCLGSCGGQSNSGDCYCDDQCEGYGDCCEDYEPVCDSGACGGFAGMTCQGDQYCDFDPNATCGWADAQGTCQDRPEYCAEVFAPVCGCDGTTYDNECFANAAGTGVLQSGECDGTPPPDPEPEPTTTCSGSCGGKSSTDDCYCDEQCQSYGDCCDDFGDACTGRTAASGVCVRNSNDECQTDDDCMAGGCGGELCFNPDVSSGISTCDCASPQNVAGCGCVEGSCTWWN